MSSNVIRLALRLVAPPPGASDDAVGPMNGGGVVASYFPNHVNGFRSPVNSSPKH
jgi:hypothetical protein